MSAVQLRASGRLTVLQGVNEAVPYYNTFLQVLWQFANVGTVDHFKLAVKCHLWTERCMFLPAVLWSYDYRFLCVVVSQWPLSAAGVLQGSPFYLPTPSELDGGITWMDHTAALNLHK